MTKHTIYEGKLVQVM